MIAWDYRWEFNVLMWVVAALCMIMLVQDRLRDRTATRYCEFEGCDDEADIHTAEHGWLCWLHFRAYEESSR